VAGLRGGTQGPDAASCGRSSPCTRPQARAGQQPRPTSSAAGSEKTRATPGVVEGVSGLGRRRAGPRTAPAPRAAWTRVWMREMQGPGKQLPDPSYSRARIPSFYTGSPAGVFPLYHGLDALGSIFLHQHPAVPGSYKIEASAERGSCFAGAALGAPARAGAIARAAERRDPCPPAELNRAWSPAKQALFHRFVAAHVSFTGSVSSLEVLTASAVDAFKAELSCKSREDLRCRHRSRLLAGSRLPLQPRRRGA
jgi:hypothetical protein